MATDTSEPRFSRESFRSVEDISRRLRDRVYDLLEEKLRRERRVHITKEDVKTCVQQAMQELSEELQEA